MSVSDCGCRSRPPDALEIILHLHRLEQGKRRRESEADSTGELSTTTFPLLSGVLPRIHTAHTVTMRLYPITHVCSAQDNSLVRFYAMLFSIE
jgi:hypothetical protein